MPGTFAERLHAIDADIARYLDDLEVLLADKNSPVRLDEHGDLHLSPLAAEVVDPVVLAERDAVVARLPGLPLTALLTETDLEATGARTSRTPAARGRASRSWSIGATSTRRSSPRPATTAPAETL